MLPFVGVDGEGANLPDKWGFVRHRYTMLRAGNEFITADDPAPGAWHRWLEFLARRPKGYLYVSYFFDYDVTMMLRDLPDADIHTLCSGEDIHYGPYTVRWRPRKELRVTAYRHRTVVMDVGTFFQSTFLTALKRWGIGTDAQLAQIADGKEDRANFGQLTSREIDYNKLECELLAELMTKFRRTCEVIGYLPRSWTGPGQLAKAMLRAHSIPYTDQLPFTDPLVRRVWHWAQAAYYGGRFETSAVGPVKGPIEAWDINSAYPYATTKLPCLMHAAWKRTHDIVPEGLYQIRYTHPPGQMWHTLPHRRSDGTIHYPREGAGWYWGVELLAAMAAGCEVTVLQGVRWWATGCDCTLFNFMHRLYSIRKAVGKTEAGIALKLAMNSVYGVLAQTIGAAPYANPVWAGLITAHTRARIMSAVSLRPDDVYMIATDGIFTGSDYPLSVSDELGGWDRKSYPSLHIIQPGLYFAGEGLSKTRGVPLSAIRRHRTELVDAWQGKLTDGYDVPVRQFNGLRISAHRNALGMAGEWVDTTKRVGYDWSNKRGGRQPIGGRTWPYPGSQEEESTPYSKLIGGNVDRDNDRLEFEGMPDWASTLTELE